MRFVKFDDLKALIDRVEVSDEFMREFGKLQVITYKVIPPDDKAGDNDE